MSISENGHDSSGLVIDDVTGVLVGFRLPSALSAWSLEESGKWQPNPRSAALPSPMTRSGLLRSPANPL